MFHHSSQAWPLTRREALGLLCRVLQNLGCLEGMGKSLCQTDEQQSLWVNFKLFQIYLYLLLFTVLVKRFFFVMNEMREFGQPLPFLRSLAVGSSFTEVASTLKPLLQVLNNDQSGLLQPELFIE